jgi:hypothetical protein
MKVSFLFKKKKKNTILVPGDEGEGIYGRMVSIGTKMTLLPNKKIAMHRVRISVQYTVTEDNFYRQKLLLQVSN